MRDEIAMGPDMADVGSRLTKEEILRSILDPNAVIAAPVEKHTEDGISRMPELSDPSAKDDIKDIVIFFTPQQTSICQQDTDCRRYRREL